MTIIHPSDEEAAQAGAHQPPQDGQGTLFEPAPLDAEIPDVPADNADETQPVASAAPATESSIQQPTEPTEKAAPAKRRWLKPVAAAVAALSIGTGVMAANSKHSTEKQGTPVTATAPANPNPNAPTTAAPNTAQAPSTTEAPAPTTEVVAADSLTGTRPDGELIHVEPLANPATSSPDQLAHSVFDLISAYATTGDQKFMDAISTSPDVQQAVQEMIDGAVNDLLQQNDLTATGLPKDYQFVIFDGKGTSDNPLPAPTFTQEGSWDGAFPDIKITLASGTVYASPYTNFMDHGAPWKDPSAEREDYTFRNQVTDFSIDIAKGPDGKPEVSSFTATRTRAAY